MFIFLFFIWQDELFDEESSAMAFIDELVPPVAPIGIEDMSSLSAMAFIDEFAPPVAPFDIPEFALQEEESCPPDKLVIVAAVRAQRAKNCFIEGFPRK